MAVVKEVSDVLILYACVSSGVFETLQPLNSRIDRRDSMKKEKFQLDELELQSFVTELTDDETKRVMGGDGLDYDTCVDQATGGSKGEYTCTLECCFLGTV